HPRPPPPHSLPRPPPAGGSPTWLAQLLTGAMEWHTGQAAICTDGVGAEAGAGQHRGTAKKTGAELLERWCEWRQEVRPISPSTVHHYRHWLDSVILPAFGKLPVQRLDAPTLDRPPSRPASCSASRWSRTQSWGCSCAWRSCSAPAAASCVSC